MIVSSIEKNNYVLYNTQYGRGRGKWVGSLPKPHEVYSVEFELADNFCWGINLHNSHDKVAKIDYRSEKNYFTGQLESIEEKYAVLRLNDAIIPFEITGKIESLVGSYITLETYEVLIYTVEY